MSGINNPFAPTPASVVQSTANRFPDISNDAALQQQQQQHQSQYGQQQQGYYPQQQQQQLGYLQTQQTGYVSQPPSGGAYPTSSMPASPFGAAQQPSYQGQGAYNNQAQAQYGGYPSQQQQPPQQQQFSSAPPVSFSVSDLDPYSHLGTLHQSQLSQPPSPYSSQPQQQGVMMGQDGNMALPSHLVNVQQVQTHPRQYVQENKAIWTQLLARFDTLREAWEARKSAVKQVALQGADPSAVERLTKDADTHIDSIHASKFQLAEVKDTWRQSADAASQVLPRKARVREALNAGLNSLPEYPAPLSPEQVGGAFYRRAAEEYRKQNIMSGYQQPQMTGHPQQHMQPQQYGIQAQPTGYYPPQQQQQPGGYLQTQPTGFYGGGGGGYQQGYY
ncbi:BZ3500_MvSof-1268-A1-R1_Chr1-1g01132 [Microbotryum saponariae]|uniref:BZ3500_MvSof-1268-A1-R1_Chr1-1g01132 protein n=1 Tax=Microbotryum saponariae TaxID=289078 RepID=A0A2X0K8F4_9BASI|nr:BZ3500_MvSof-1268-A1-R1_Chr1-1g01132 [Microbotryum saponariae]SCZ93463.1 BZ3501_MvSof-1269-A2-R1_Chr1-1g00729 [Microbotryum saponariae]